MRLTLHKALKIAYRSREALRSPGSYAACLRKDAADPVGRAQAGPYPEGDGGWRFQFERLPVHDALLRTYRLDEIAGQGDIFTRVLRIMDWLTAHTWYNGHAIWPAWRFQGSEDSLRILRYAYDGPFRRCLNCRHKAFVFADCLTAAGMHAMPVAMGGDSGGCHFTVHAWLPEARRWVMLDPSFNAYLTDETGRALNLVEIQGRHRQGEKLCAAQYSLNGTQDCRDIYLEGFLLASLLRIYARDGKDTRAITAIELLAEPISIIIDQEEITC
ncbi:MAG: transglutaminase family protein [Oscillospiraceae bacterium]|jgi:hypothetical protein|nr:transglutaminase family protein [Oscillospiraceae bacterium]